MENEMIEFSSKVLVSKEVIARIAAIAALEVKGVSAMGNNMTSELLDKVGMRHLLRNVKVEYVAEELTIDLAVTLEYGVNIPGTSQAVQAKVKQTVENMTGLTVADVNVRISGVNLNQ